MWRNYVAILRWKYINYFILLILLIKGILIRNNQKNEQGYVHILQRISDTPSPTLQVSSMAPFSRFNSLAHLPKILRICKIHPIYKSTALLNSTSPSSLKHLMFIFAIKSSLRLPWVLEYAFSSPLRI